MSTVNFEMLPSEVIDLQNIISIKDDLNTAYTYICYIQNKSETIGDINLSFYPIAKNIRFASSQMAINCLNKCSSEISDLPRNGEIAHWKSIGRGSWFPWLWARNRLQGFYSNKEGWNYYFKSFNNVNNDTVYNHITIYKEVPLFLIYLACLKYTFSLNDVYILGINKYKKQMKWPDNSHSILAMHIRRGDTCTPDTTISFRKIYSIEEYILKADILIDKFKYTHVFISTDSESEIDTIKELRPYWNVLSVPFNRNEFYRSEGNPIDIEDKCRLEPDRIPFVVESAIIDLYFISQCHGYISTITSSEFSKLGLLLQFSFQEKITPYINLCNKTMDISSIIMV